MLLKNSREGGVVEWTMSKRPGQKVKEANEAIDSREVYVGKHRAKSGCFCLKGVSRRHCHIANNTNWKIASAAEAMVLAVVEVSTMSVSGLLWQRATQLTVDDVDQ